MYKSNFDQRLSSGGWLVEMSKMLGNNWPMIGGKPAMRIGKKLGRWTLDVEVRCCADRPVAAGVGEG
jgi:hypothetical protein